MPHDKRGYSGVIEGQSESPTSEGVSGPGGGSAICWPGGRNVTEFPHQVALSWPVNCIKDLNRRNPPLMHTELLSSVILGEPPHGSTLPVLEHFPSGEGAGAGLTDIFPSWGMKPWGYVYSLYGEINSQK